MVEDDAPSNNYGHDNPQIHQVQHIANVETLQQFSPAYPVQPIYRPVVYNHGANNLPYFKQNDEPTVRTVNATDSEVKAETSKESETVEKTEVLERSENTLSTGQTEKVEKLDVLTTEGTKLEAVDTTKLPAPIVEVLALNASAKTN